MFYDFHIADVTLSQKLKEELGYEKETGGASKDIPQFLKDFQAQNVWTVSTILCLHACFHLLFVPILPCSFQRRNFAGLY